MRAGSLVDGIISDSRLGLRQLRSNPGFTAIAILTLALGIGANTAIFTLVHAVIIRRLPVAAPDQLYVLGDTKVCCDTTGFQDNFALYSYPLYERIRRNTPDNAYQTWANYIDGVQLLVAGRPENLEGAVRETLAGIDPNMTPRKS